MQPVVDFKASTYICDIGHDHAQHAHGDSILTPQANSACHAVSENRKLFATAGVLPPRGNGSACGACEDADVGNNLPGRRGGQKMGWSTNDTRPQEQSRPRWRPFSNSPYARSRA